MILLGIAVCLIIWSIITINDGLWSSKKSWNNRINAYDKQKKVYHSYGYNGDISLSDSTKRGQNRMFWDRNGQGYTVLVSKPDMFGKQKIYLETAQYVDKSKANQTVAFKPEDLRDWKAMGMI